MGDKDPMDMDSRIKNLEDEGRLSGAEAEALRGAFAEQGGPAVEPPPAARNWPPRSREFLGGHLSEQQFRAAGRRAGVQMAVVAGVLFFVLSFLVGLLIDFAGSLDLRPGSRVLVLFSSQLGAGVFFGLLFGWWMYRAHMRPAIERQIRLRREAGPLAPIPSVDAGQCPSCRAERFSEPRGWKAAKVHWFLNPGLAFNELVLGQRVVSQVKLCDECRAQVVDCPHCHRAIDGMHWSGRNALFHWTELLCPFCAGKLPTMSNGVAWLVRLPFVLIAGAVQRLGGRP